MERERRVKRPLSEAAELFDLPADVVAGLPQEEIDINGEGLIVKVLGSGLELVSMTGEALRIQGKIQRVEWVK